METVKKYAVAAAILGLIPFSFVVLIPMELAMVYHLSIVNRRPFSISELGAICTALLFCSTVLHVFIGLILDFAGPAGWVVKAGIAAVFVLAFGGLVNWYYETENRKHA